MPASIGETLRVRGAVAAAGGWPDQLMLEESLQRQPTGALWRARWGDAQVLVDARAGKSEWQPEAAPSPWLPVAGDVTLPDGHGVVYQSARGELLERIFGAGPAGGLDASRALRIASQIARGLVWLHARGRAHHALTPDHVLVGPNDGVSLLGLGHARPLAREHVEAFDDRGDAVLPYLAPEQTGRVGRPTDARTDLYGLGALLYRLLGGRPPAQGRDRLELMHAVIARPPAPLPVDPALNALLERLLAKDAHDRYQTAQGVLDDLERCLAALTGGMSLGGIDLGVRDRAGLLVLPDALYGRDVERAELLERYARADAGAPQVVLVSGGAGSGKSRLIEAVRQDAEVVLWGKFDPTDGGSPHAALGRALDAALDRALGLSELRLRQLRERIVTEVGAEIGALRPILPRLPLLVGEVQSDANFEPDAAALRLQRALAGMLRALTPATQPVVLVIDDLQWADASSFRMLAAVAAAIPRLLLVGAYRADEVGAEHPLRGFARDQAAHQLALGPIGDDAVCAMVAAALQSTPAAVADLARDLGTRTRGNPFFLRWFLRELHRRGALAIGGDGVWRIDVADGEAVGVADNVAALLADRLGELPAEVQELLQAAAVAGTWLDPALLGEALGWDDAALQTHLAAALQAEVVDALRGGAQRRYRFAHDRLREAALASLDEPRRLALSLALGRALWRREEPDLFEVAGLLNPVADRLDAQERGQLLELDLAAAERALQARALDAARRLTEAAWGLLGAEPWRDHPDAARRCRELQGELAFQRGESDAAIAFADDVLAHTETGLPQSTALLLQQSVYGTTGRVREALDVCYRHMALMGEPMARVGTMATMMVELGRSLWELRGREPESILSLPPTRDPRKLAVLHGIASATGIVDSPFSVMQRAIRSLRLTLRYGPSRHSAFACSTYGAMLAGPLGRIEQGERFGRVGLQIIERFDARDLESRVLTNYYGFVAHWSHPLGTCVAGLDQAMRSARRHGDVTFTAGSSLFWAQARLLIGAELPALLRDVRGLEVELASDPHNRDRIKTYGALLALLCEPELARSRVAGDLFADFAGLDEHEDQFTSAQWRALRGIAAWAMGDLAAARREFDLARPLQDALFSMPLLVWARLVDAVSALQAVAERPSELGAARRLARRVRRWLAPRAALAPFNFGHLMAWLDAEVALAAGDAGAALAGFADAIEGADDNGFRLDAAMLRLRRAACHGAAGRPRAERVERQAAVGALRAIGALGLVARLEDADPTLRAEAAAASSGRVDVDVETLVRAGAAIAGELHLDRLLTRLTSLLLQNAGAQRAVLVTAAEQGWRVDAEEGPDGHRQPRLALDEAGELLCLRAARLALRSGQVVSVDDAGGDHSYRDDAYVQATSTRSILAIPLLRAGETSGLVYLESRLSAGTFDAARARAVSLLAGQIGFALDNARLFDETEGLKVASERFVPKRLLGVLGKRDIRDVKIGDSVEGTMTVMFADIRRFTTLSEGMTPKQTFAFVNEYLRRMEPFIAEHGGFIDKYIGDAIMAVFPGEADGALRAAQAMLGAVRTYNAEPRADDLPPLQIGIGLHRGPLMLGTVGGTHRMDGTVIGDTVNLASRIESLTKSAGVPLLFSGQLRDALRHDAGFALASMGTQQVRGRDEEVALFTLAEVVEPPATAA